MSMVGGRSVGFDNWRENALQHSPNALAHCHPTESTIQAACTRAVRVEFGARGVLGLQRNRQHSQFDLEARIRGELTLLRRNKR